MITASPFRPAWWLRSRHLQTLWHTLWPVRAATAVVAQEEQLELPDGDVVDLSWGVERPGPLVLLLHGLAGSVQSHYAVAMMRTLTEAGYYTLFMHFRGCGETPNRLRRSYHAGDGGDIAFVVKQLNARFPGRALAAVSVSLGANALLKWLGERGDQTPLSAVIAISPPFELAAAARTLERGVSRLYQWFLIARLRHMLRQKAELLADRQLERLARERYRNFFEFDDRVTAPLHGFRDVDHYYQESSCRGYLRAIQVPTVIIHAGDDPFLAPSAIPSAAELAPAVTLELSRSGGHVGFIAGAWPGIDNGYLEQRVLHHLSRLLAESA